MGNEFDPHYISEKIYFQVGQKALIMNNREEVLFLKRSDNTGGKWSFPGGGLEKGEESMESIKREIKEETNLEGMNFQMYYIITSTTETDEAGIIIGYTCESVGEIVLNWEHTEYRWLPPKDGMNLELTPHAKILLEKFIEKNV